jgi:hypothetical protein
MGTATPQEADPEGEAASDINRLLLGCARGRRERKRGQRRPGVQSGAQRKGEGRRGRAPGLLAANGARRPGGARQRERVNYGTSD